mmetsp:Transcript_4437/g.4454  ORF Transcript_4437/g.4454 Transcript_4437/m.4454 type:complete len:189 (-) Transcript_4437:258-824(-)
MYHQMLFILIINYPMLILILLVIHLEKIINKYSQDLSYIKQMNDLALTNKDIEQIYERFKINLIACIDYHDLKLYGLNDGSYILNLGNQHWTGLFVSGNEGVYFDPFGVIYPVEVKKFCPKLIYSDDTIQSLKSVYCGYYVLAFLYYMTNKFQYNLEYTLNQFRSKFNDDTKKNDRLLQTLIKKILKD